MFFACGIGYDSRRSYSSDLYLEQEAGRGWQGLSHNKKQEFNMSKKALFAVALVAFVAACAKKEETVYVQEPVAAEPVYTGKYK